MEEEREELRREVLLLAQNDEILTELQRAKLKLFGSLVHGDKGNILGGSLTENRFTAFWDLAESVMPWEKVERPQGAQSNAPVDEDAAREAFLSDYKDAVEKGLL